jgi:LemA protein
MRRLFINFCFLLGLAAFSSCGYNDMTEKEEGVSGAWAQVEAQYQRRNDLIPQLVDAVQAAGDYERNTLKEIMEARASATQIKLDAKDLSEENIAKFQAAQNQLSGALGRLMMITENYPNLKTNDQITGLMAEISGTENRITVARNRFNEAVQDYNTYIRKFPNNMTAGMFGFEKKGYFKADPGAERVPQRRLDFSNKDKK